MFNEQLYNTTYHDIDLSNYSFLITGGAGFIGSNLVEYLLKYNAGHVRVLDNLSNGYYENINDFVQFKNFEFIEGDIRDFDTCKKAVEGINYISHQAALGSVPRSIADPITSNNVNISGFVNMLTAAKESNTLKRFVYAASSSTYGDSASLPKVEGIEGKPLSPYAVTKLVNELYAEIFSKTYGLHSTGLRYFNVFGPKQSPTNAYAAVIPKFITSALRQTSPAIFGDGETSRDFTFIENVVQANIKALLNYSENQNHEVLNIAFGDRTSLNKLWSIIVRYLNCESLIPNYYDERVGDVKHSLADISKAKNLINYSPLFGVEQGLKITIEYLKTQNYV
ncbi:MAG: SDR family oxidoreductase [Flavobacterium sp.]|uniref:SDR family oxidoreductase n=1 Tax=Flavobacterium sp. TaxID=239 RepID=UPI003BDBF922